jgi:hypothetical protein
MACYREFPRRGYHPGTAIADHRDIEEAVKGVLDACQWARYVNDGSSIADFGPPDLQISIEGLL